MILSRSSSIHVESCVSTSLMSVLFRELSGKTIQGYGVTGGRTGQTTACLLAHASADPERPRAIPPYTDGSAG